MLSGQLDIAKARIIVEQVRLLSDAQARTVVDKILPEAGAKTTSQLRYRLARLVIAIDPAAARKRYREAVKNRRVWYGREEEGTASLGGRYLPVEQAAAAFDHLDALATALIDAGDTRGLDELRADVLLNLLQGRTTPLHPHAEPAPTGTAGTGGERGGNGATPGSAAAADAGGGDPGHGNAADSDAASSDTGSGAATGAADTGAAASADAAGMDADRGDDRTSGDTSENADAPPRGGGRFSACPHGCRSGALELTVPLETLMDLADDAGELGSWGPVIADVARSVADHLKTASWRFSVTDKAGRVIWNGPTRRRPTTGDAEYVRARDRRCRFPSCRRRARRCHLDHTHEHQHGGPSIPCNIGALCARHHRLKTLGTWKLWQIPDGTFIWVSPLGRTYVVKPEPVDDPNVEPEPEPEPG